MANNVIKRVWNQNKMVTIEDLKGMTFQAESGGHTFQISGVDDAGNTVALTGSVAGVFLRPDNTDVAITGSASDGVVSVTLPANCYDVPGRFGLTVFVTANGQKTAVYAAVGTVSRTSSGTVSPGTASDVVDLINQINAAVATIPASWTGLMADIAPTYSDAAVYPVGAYCYYNGDLYRCTTAITTAESWTAGHWTQAVLGNDVTDLKDAIELNRNGNDTLPKETAKSTFTKITGYFCRVSETGTALQNCLFQGSAYVLVIDCRFLKTITYPVFNTSSRYGTAFFDSDDLTISGHYNTSQTTGTMYTIDVPANAVKCLVTIPNGLDSMEWNISYTSPSLKGLDGSVEELIQEQSETNLTLKYLLDTECEYKYFNDGDWGEELVAYSGKAFSTMGVMGQTVENVTKSDVASLRNYKIDISNYKKVAFPAYKSQSNLGELFADSNDIVCGTYTNPTYDSGTIVVVEVPENAKYLYISRNINWDTSICFLIGAVNALENNGGSSVIIVHDDSYPSLTDSEKAEIVSLCEDYYDARSNFKYGGNYRNQYANSGCISNGKFYINCGNFAQFIWMGRSASDFNPNNYTPYINKEFDWGYYFYFLIHRKCYGIYKNQSAATDSEKYYGYQHPTGSNAYSFNTFDNGNGMRFRPFMAAADLAFELFNMGCEVPRRAVEVGDMIFYRGPEYSGMTNETQLNFRNISHVGICIDNDYNGLGILRVMESTFYDPTGDISIISLDETDINNRLRAGMYENRIVMCARHPHAFGVPTNVPNAITAI